MKKISIKFIIIFLTYFCVAKELKSSEKILIKSEQASFQEKLACKEIRRYIYLRTVTISESIDNKTLSTDFLF